MRQNHDLIAFDMCFRTCFIIGEEKRKLYFIKELYALQIGEHGLDTKNLRRFQIKAKVTELIFIQIIPFSVPIILGGIHLFLTYLSISLDNKFSLPSMIFSNVCFTTFAVFAANEASRTLSINYLSLYYLKLRFEQINAQFKESIRNNFK